MPRRVDTSFLIRKTTHLLACVEKLLIQKIDRSYAPPLSSDGVRHCKKGSYKIPFSV